MNRKMIIGLVLVIVVAFMLGTVNSYATELTATTTTENKTNTGAVTISTGNSTANKTGNAAVSTTVSTGASNTANNATKNTTNNVVNNAANSSTYTTNSTKLPKAGSNPTIIFVAAALVISAVYAYKKVTDYNI